VLKPIIQVGMALRLQQARRWARCRDDDVRDVTEPGGKIGSSFYEDRKLLKGGKLRKESRAGGGTPPGRKQE
jgi:hypothetical protein